MSIKFTERDVEDYIFQNPECIRTSWHGRVVGWSHRQLAMPSGILDLLGAFETGDIVVAEIKNVPASSSAITQVSRYADDLYQILGRAGLKHPQRIIPVIVAPDYSDKVFRECKACNVIAIQFSASLTLNVSTIRWSNNHVIEEDKVFIDISQTEEIKQLVDVSRSLCEKETNMDSQLSELMGDLDDKDNN